MSEQKTEELEPRTLENQGSVPKWEEKLEDVEMPTIPVPEYGYGIGQNTLDATKALRNLPWIKVKAWTAQRTTTGNQAITGVGFRPKAIRITAVASGSPSGACFGYADDSWYQQTMYGFNNPSSMTWSYAAGKAVYLQWSWAGTSVATVASFDSDGFTLNWSSIWPVADFRYECVG